MVKVPGHFRGSNSTLLKRNSAIAKLLIISVTASQRFMESGKDMRFTACSQTSAKEVKRVEKSCRVRVRRNPPWRNTID